MTDFFSGLLVFLVCGFFIYSLISFVHWLIDLIISKKKGKK